MSQWATLSEPRSPAPPRGNDEDDSEDEIDQLRPSVSRSFRASPPMDRTRPPSTVPAKRRNDRDDEREGRQGPPKRPRQSEPGRPVPPRPPVAAGRQPPPPAGNRQGPIVRRVMVEKGSLPDFRPAAQRERDRDRDRPTGGDAARVAGGSNRPAPPAFNRPALPGHNRPGQPASNRPGQSGSNRPGPPGSNRPPLPAAPRHSTGSSAPRNAPARNNAPARPGPSSQPRPSTSANSARRDRPNISASQPARRRESPDSSPSPPPPATQPAVLNGVRPFPLATQVAKRREDRRNSFKYDQNGAIEISSSDDEGPPVLNRRHTMPAMVLLPGTHMEGDALVIEDSDEEPAGPPPPKPAAPAAKATQATTTATQKAAAKSTAAAKPGSEPIDLTFSDDEDELLLRPAHDDPPPPRSPSPPMPPPGLSPSPPPLPSPRSPSPRSLSPPPVPSAPSLSPPPLPSPSPPPPPSPSPRSLEESRPSTPIRIGPPRGKRPSAPSTPLTARKDPDVIEFPSSPAGPPATPSIRIGPPIGKRPVTQSPAAPLSASSAFTSSGRPSATVAPVEPTPDAGASSSSRAASAGAAASATSGSVDPLRSLSEQPTPPTVTSAPGIATLDDEDMDIEDEEEEEAAPVTASAPPARAAFPPQPPEYYLQYFTAPAKTADGDGTLRWTFLCKLCETLRSLPRGEREQEFDSRVSHGLFGNFSTHVRECHLGVDPAQLRDVTVRERGAQWKGRRRFTITSAGDLVLGPWHLPENGATGAGAASNIAGSDPPEAPTVPAVPPPAVQLETPVPPERPQPRQVGRLRVHLVEDLSPAADTTFSPEGAPELDGRSKRLLSLWGPPQKVLWNDVPRWYLACKSCPAERTLARNPRCKTFEEEQLNLGTLRQHFTDKHPRALALVEKEAATAALESQTRPKPTGLREDVDPQLMEIDDEDRWDVESPVVAKARGPQAAISRSQTPTPPPQTPPHAAGELRDEDGALSFAPAENLPHTSASIPPVAHDAQTPARRGPGVDTPLRTQARPPVSSRPVNPFASPTVFHPLHSSAKAKRVGAIEQYMSPLRKERDPPAMSPTPSAHPAPSAQTPRPAFAPHPLAEMQGASSSGALTDDDADVFGPTRANSSPSIVALSRQPSALADADVDAPCPEVDMAQVAVEPDALRAPSCYRTESPASSLEVRQMLEDDGIARPVPVPVPAATAEVDRTFSRVLADAFLGVWRRRVVDSAATSNLDTDTDLALDIPPTPPPPVESPPPVPVPAVDPAVAAALTVARDPSPSLLAPAMEAVMLQSDPERQPSQDADDRRRRTRSMSRHSTGDEAMSNDGLPLIQAMRLKRARHARRSDASLAPGASVQQASPPDSSGDFEPLASDCGPSAGISTRSKEIALVKTAREMRWPAEEVDTLIYDVINDLHEYNQYDESLRTVFEHVMIANTLHDEPDAPPITVDNKINDDPCPPWEFYYTNKLLYGQNVRRGDPTKLKGCNCVGGCRPDSKTCACLLRQQRHFQLNDGNKTIGFNYDQNGRVVDPQFPIFECNDACGCDETCMNRVVQHGRQVPVEIANTRKKGWGVFAKSSIPANTFIGIYAGELITDRESHARGAIYELFGRTYMFAIDNWYLTNKYRRKYRKLHRPHTLSPDDHGEERPDDGKQPATFVVDAFHVGNFTRFLNHCCDPNCVVVSVHINEPHIYKPYLCLFTCKDVKAGEELTFSYRGVIDEEEFIEAKKQNKGKRRKRGVGLKGQCQCGAPRCIGTLF